MNGQVLESQRTTFVKQLKLGKVIWLHCSRLHQGLLGCSELVLNLHSSLAPPASPVPLHPFTAADLVQRRNAYQKTGACAVRRVPVNGPLQAQRILTEESEDQMCSKSLSDRKFRRASGKDNCQWHRYSWIFLFFQYLFFSFLPSFSFLCFILTVTCVVFDHSTGEHQNNNNKPFTNGTCSSLFLHTSPQLSLACDFR